MAFSWNPVIGSEGDIKGFRTSGRDITDRKKVEEALFESERRFRTVAGETLLGIYETDANGDCIYVNDRWCQFAGMTPHEAMGEGWKRGLHPDDRERIAALWYQYAKSNEPWHLEYRFITPEGRVTWVLGTAIALRDEQGAINGYLGSNLDITGRKRAEEELRWAHESLQMALTASSAGTWDWDVVTGHIQWSSQMFGLFGLDPQKDSASFESWRSVLHPEDAALAESRIERAVEQRTDLNSDYRVILPDGKARWISAVGKAEYDDQGRPIRMTGICVDITPRKQAQEEKERMEVGLRHAQKLQAVGTLASGVAHEFNNLLGTIMGYAEMVQEQVRGRDDILADISQVVTASERGRDLVRNILSFTRKAEPQARPLNLNTEIRNSKELLGQLLPRTVSIEPRLAPDLKRVSMAASHLNQILINLATNANQAMPDGGTLTVKTENISIERMLCFVCGEHFSGEYVLLTVVDTGHGMDGQTMERIFEPFFSTKEVGSGTGLGLSVVQGLVKSYGGHIICQSEVGLGTTFKIYLPVLQLEEVSLVTEGFSQPAVGKRPETILLVDDEEPLRNLAQRYFSDVGYAVHQAGSGEDALEIYRQNPGRIDLVVLDLGMAGMGGHKCLKEILTINPKAKVVIASGYTTDGQDQQALAEGAAAFVGKPFMKAELLATVRSVLDEK